VLCSIVCLNVISSEMPDGLDSKMSNLDFIYEILDNRIEFESFAESAELSALDGFEVVPVEFEPYGED
jgi:hypothetical protein